MNNLQLNTLRAVTAVATLLLGDLALAQERRPTTDQLLDAADHAARDEGVSPVRRIDRDQPPRISPFRGPYRSIDGSNNNLESPAMGAAETPMIRLMPAVYVDGLGEMVGANRPNPRDVSNAVNAQGSDLPNRARASDFLWQWGQFLDHDLDLTDGIDPPEHEDVEVPAGDPFFDPHGTGSVSLAFNRSIYDPDSGLDAGYPRAQLNEITAWIDASNVYGSDVERAEALRALDGSGRLASSAGELLPYNSEGHANAGGSSDALFLAGDVRANEQVALTAMHTLFVREHNRRAAQIARRQPGLDGEVIYQRARSLVAAHLQVITYREFLPLLLGDNALAPYRGYDPEVDASIRNEFSSAAFRLGHSMLSTQVLRLDSQGGEIEFGHLPLRDAFFSPHRLADEGGIEPLLRGLAAQVCQSIDVFVVDDVRNFLFGAPGSGGFDLATLNIQRGRDHGLPSYNDMRQQLGYEPLVSIAGLNADRAVVERLASVYASADDIDLWIGGLAESHADGALVGPTFQRILAQQFEALRDGDRFWYSRVLSAGERREVESTTLADIIRRNTRIGDELSDDVFRVRDDLPRPAAQRDPRPARQPARARR